MDDAKLSEERIALNEATMRRVNEAIKAGHREEGGSAIGLVCECGRLGCNDIVELTPEDYERVRADPRSFIAAPGHATEVDVVDREESGYEVVSKRPGPGTDIAEATDPRGAGDPP